MSPRGIAPGKLTAREVRQRIAARFGKMSEATSFPEHVVLFEVPFVGRGTRYSRQRMDVVAIGVWSKTRGLIHGFEVKVSRADLLHELRDLTKSEHAARNVDRFWLVLASADLMRDTDPIPEDWGIIVCSGRGTRIVRSAQPQSGDVDRDFIVGLVTRSLVQPTIGRQTRYRDGLIRGQRWGEDYVKSMRESYQSQNDALRRQLVQMQAELEEAKMRGLTVREGRG